MTALVLPAESHPPGADRDVARVGAGDEASRPHRRAWWAAVLVPVLVAVVGAVLASGTVRDDGPSVIAVRSDAPVFDTLVDLVAASDAVVLAEVTGARPGPVVGAPGGAVRTTLFTLHVVDVAHGSAVEVVELVEPTALADGTPVTVDGVAPPEVGTRGVFFLVAAGPGRAVSVGSQARYVVDGDSLVAADPDDPLAARLAAGGGPALVAAIRAG